MGGCSPRSSIRPGVLGSGIKAWSDDDLSRAPPLNYGVWRQGRRPPAVWRSADARQTATAWDRHLIWRSVFGVFRRVQIVGGRIVSLPRIVLSERWIKILPPPWFLAISLAAASASA